MAIITVLCAELTGVITLFPNDFKERKETICSCKTTLSEQVTNYFISSESCPFYIDKKKWSKMKEQERLEIHLKLNAEGKEFAYELI